jgi:phosphoribosylamine--glycine ligase
MNVLILGSGGREHALAWKISQSPLCDRLFVGPGNGGTSTLATNLSLDLMDFYEVAMKVKEYEIDVLIVGPEAPLVGGIVDYFSDSSDFDDLLIIGPRKSGAALEGSKDFAKEFMDRHGIPTSPHQTFRRSETKEVAEYLEGMSPPYVLKADGLAAGKGVLILNSLEEAKIEVELMLSEGKFGAASDKVVIEKFLDGVEISVFALTDGRAHLLLPSAKDYKRVGEGDTGLNTGGMGAVSPVPFADGELLEKIQNLIVTPTIRGLEADGIPYTGFLFFGLMIVDGNPYVIEYNVRMGDPETEVVMPRIKSDLLAHLVAAARGELSREVAETDDRYATTVMTVSGGYPGKYEKGKPIAITHTGTDDRIIFHAGTKLEQGILKTAGGRVMAATALDRNLGEALRKSYEMVDNIEFEGKYFRADIGKDLLT